MEEQPTIINPVLERFRQIEHNFNKNYLILLFQVKGIVEEEEEKTDQEQHALLSTAYEYWFDLLQEDPRNMDACVLFYDAVKEYHDLLLGRDEQIFSINGDFFSNIFAQKGIDTVYLYEQLRDPLDEEEDETLQQEEEEDAKANLWDGLINLYRLAVLICIYLKMPLVKDIIDMILINNPDLNQRNIFDKIYGEFKGSRRMRAMIMKLLKSKGDSFGEIFTSLQRVISTFSQEVNMDQSMKANVDLAKKQVRNVFHSILAEADLTNIEETKKEELIQAMENRDQETLDHFVQTGVLSQEQLDKICTDYKAQGLDKMNVTKVVQDLGSTMERMMEAIQNKDESAMQEILASSTSGLNIDPEELERMQKEMEAEMSDLTEEEEEEENENEDGGEQKHETKTEE